MSIKPGRRNENGNPRASIRGLAAAADGRPGRPSRL